jgi:hypothetical protein
MAEDPRNGAGGLLAQLPSELIAVILSMHDDISATTTSYTIALMITKSCTFWHDSNEQARLFNGVTAVTLPTAAALQFFTTERYLPNLKCLVISGQKDASWAGNALQKIVSLYSPQLETLSWLWSSDDPWSAPLRASLLVLFPWPKLHTLEARIGRFKPSVHEVAYGAWSMAMENEFTAEDMLKGLPNLRQLRVCTVNNEDQIQSFRAAVQVCQNQLEELVIKTIKDPSSEEMLKHPSTRDVAPGDSELGTLYHSPQQLRFNLTLIYSVYSYFKLNDFTNLHCFATSHLPQQLSSTVISASAPLRANIWSTYDRASAIGTFLSIYGLKHLPDNPILPDFNQAAPRLCPRGGILPLLSVLKSTDISIADLDVLVALGADPFARCFSLYSGSTAPDYHGNIFTHALLDPEFDNMFQKLFRQVDGTTGLTFFEKAVTRCRGEWSIHPTDSASILHTIAKIFKWNRTSFACPHPAPWPKLNSDLSASIMEPRIEWMIKHCDALKIDLNIRNSEGLAFVHLCRTPQIFTALLMSQQCDTDALDTQGRGALECAIAARRDELACTLYQRRSTAVGLPLRVFLLTVEVAYLETYRAKSNTTRTATTGAGEHENAWIQLVEWMYRDSMPQMRLAPIDQLNPERIKQFCFVFGTIESGRTLPWSRSPYRTSETLFEAILRISMGRLLASEGLQCLKALLEDPNVHANDLVSKSGFTALHILAEADLCSLIDNPKETGFLLEDVINILVHQKGINPDAETPAKQTALDLAFNKKVFVPTETAMAIFLRNLVAGLEDDTPTATTTTTTEEDPRKMWISSSFFERPEANNQTYRPRERARITSDDEWEEDTDPELRRVLMMSLHASIGHIPAKVKPSLAPTASYSPYGNNDDFDYDEDAMLRSALAMSLEDIRPAPATVADADTGATTNTQFSFQEDEDSDLEHVDL